MKLGSVTNIATVMNEDGEIISNHASVTIYGKALDLVKSAEGPIARS